jgi:UDPglucose--hexose-1-phosphate uridylyltransferase
MQEKFNINNHPHRRLNLLTGEWILVSPHRSKRPWQGKQETISQEKRPQHDANCYLCSGNKRADGTQNPDYENAFVFVNDFSALLENSPSGNLNDNDLLLAESQSGICKVISFSPRHDLTLAEMDVATIKNVVDVWQREFEDLSKNPNIRYIQIFENKGDVMGCSNPHPHGQIWASSELPNEIFKENLEQKKYFDKNGRSLLLNYLNLELQKQERIVCENEHFAVLVPFWATWPYETIVISKRHVQDISLFSEEEKEALAAILKSLLVRYDNLFDVSFPYSGGMHQQPVNDGFHEYWHWHMHFYPPLLRSATVKKFMVGYEMLANPQRDITAEWAAERLRTVETLHYKSKI